MRIPEIKIVIRTTAPIQREIKLKEASVKKRSRLKPGAESSETKRFQGEKRVKGNMVREK